jgi:aminopeptidase N
MNPPFHIPLAVKIGDHEQVLSIKRTEEKFTFKCKSRPVPSLLRGFSAPVILNYPYTEAELVHLLANDDDPFNRWEAAQRLGMDIILARAGTPNDAYLGAIGAILGNADHAFVAEVLTLPSETFLAEQLAEVNPDALHASRNALRRTIAAAFRDRFLSLYLALAGAGPYSPDAASSGRRALRNLALSYLMELEAPDLVVLCYEQFAQKDPGQANMTDQFAALASLANSGAPQRQLALDSFYARWKDEPLVVDKWLSVQASSRLPGTLARVRELLAHPAFDIKVPNKVYSLIRAFAGNHVRFHAADGAGYAFLADQVLALNGLNPQVAARMARGFDRWKRFDSNRRDKAKAQLERIRDHAGLSRDVAEIVTKALT